MPLPADLQATIVDLDGTLVDTLGDFVVVLNAMLEELALPGVASAFVQRTIGKGSEHLVRSTLAQVGADPARYETAFESYRRHYVRTNGRHANVYPGVVAGLERLRARGWKLACLTNKPTDFVLPLLAAKGLQRFFSVVYGGDAFPVKKPDPLPLLKTCAALGTPPSRTLMIGDSRNDAQAARAAGCPVALVTYGYNHGEPVTPSLADALVDRLDALPI